MQSHMTLVNLAWTCTASELPKLGIAERASSLGAADQQQDPCEKLRKYPNDRFGHQNLMPEFLHLTLHSAVLSESPLLMQCGKFTDS